MVCWLMFLPKIAGFLKQLEGNIGERKRLGIEVLKEIEKEEGHDKEKIGMRIEREGKEGILKIAERLRRKKKKKEEGQEEEARYEEEEVEEASEASVE